MAEERRIACILVRHDVTQVPPPVEACRQLLSTGNFSVARYWTDNSDGWFVFTAFDFFGWYDVELPVPPDSRNTVSQKARDAAAGAGVNLGAYDSFIVMAFPGQALAPNPKYPGPAQPAMIMRGYDAGADGEGPGHTAILVAFEGRTFMCHEVGHVLGFPHTYGIPTTGADWSDDGVDQLYPVYGDPYDLMSSATFGAADPTFQVPTTPGEPGPPVFPGAAGAGPMLARAHLHYVKPMALESLGKVRHVWQTGDNLVISLRPAGAGEPGQAELLVYHPAGEDDAARGRIYVEYRQHFDSSPKTRWDSGLKPTDAQIAAGTTVLDDRAHSGIIVHVVKDDPQSGTPALFYGGRITFPSVDTDVEVAGPLGTFTVTVTPEFARESKPVYVNVRVSPGHVRKWVMIETPPPEDTAVLLSSEERSIPGWDFVGPFSWERRAVTRRARYIPMTGGLGGEGAYDAASVVDLQWFIDNEPCAENGTKFLFPLYGTQSVTVHYTVDAGTRVLTVWNEPPDGPYRVTVSARGLDSSKGLNESVGDPIYAESTYDAPGIEEGWGEDYKRFMRWMYKITHPYPIRKPHLPGIDWGDHIRELRDMVNAVETSNPLAGRYMRTVTGDFERIQVKGLGKQAPTP